MEKIEEVKPANKFWRAMMFAVLFLLPLGSVYYLNKGRTHSRKAVAELENLGQVGGFELTNQQNQPISAESLHGKVTVVNFLSKNPATAQSQVSRIAKVHQSFDDTDDVVFLTFVISDSTKTLLETAKQLAIEDHKQWYLLGATEADWKRLATDVYHLSDLDAGVAMTDTSLQIRKLYDLNDNQQMGRMVEHIAKVIPKQERR